MAVPVAIGAILDDSEEEKTTGGGHSSLSPSKSLQSCLDKNASHSILHLSSFIILGIRSSKHLDRKLYQFVPLRVCHLLSLLLGCVCVWIAEYKDRNFPFNQKHMVIVAD